LTKKDIQPTHPAEVASQADAARLDLNDDADKENVQIPISKTSLVDEICKYLRNAIYNFHLKPGDQINELELIKRVGVSRSPIREAVRLLEGEGIIERHTHRGVFVKKVTLVEVREIFAIRAVLEALAAEQAIPNFGRSDLDALSEIYQEMEQAVRVSKIDVYLQLNFSFHRTFIKLAQNKALEKLLRKLGGQSRWFMFASLSVMNDNLIASLQEHRSILDSFAQGDPSLAAGIVRNHILQGGKRIEEFLSIDPAVNDAWRPGKPLMAV
jgi:DNA-binding GntR family transcriptional regulator